MDKQLKLLSKPTSVRVCAYSIFFYYSFCIKVRQSFLCLFIRSNTMLNRSKAGWSNVDCLFQHLAIVWHGSISTVFQSSFIESLATEFVIVTLSILATLGFATQAQHSWTPDFFFKLNSPGSLLSCSLWAVQHVLGKKLPVAFAVKLIVKSRECIASDSFLFSGRIISSMFCDDRANYWESVSISSSSYFSVLQNFSRKF